jgi:hypothetical protein
MWFGKRGEGAVARDRLGGSFLFPTIIPSFSTLLCAVGLKEDKLRGAMREKLADVKSLLGLWPIDIDPCI